MQAKPTPDLSLTCMSAVNKQYKRPAQIKGERALRDRNLLISPSTHNNIEVVKRKARANRLKEEYNGKYLTKGRSTSARISSPSTSADSGNTIYSVIKRTFTFCITLWIAFLVAIAFCTLVGYYLRSIYY